MLDIDAILRPWWDSIVAAHGPLELYDAHTHIGANDIALQTAADSGGRLVSFCRLDPRDSPAAEARRCLDAGAVGIKLHPRAEQFGMDEPGVREIVAVAPERTVPILIHAGRGIPALGE